MAFKDLHERENLVSYQAEDRFCGSVMETMDTEKHKLLIAEGEGMVIVWEKFGERFGGN